MKRTPCLLLLASALIAFSACEDVIELDLATTEPRLVIEGTLDASQGTATVVITYTNDFYDTTAPEHISGAAVRLEKETGDVYTLAETEGGTYVAAGIAAQAEERFLISVDVAGERYEATARVPAPVTLQEVETLEGGARPFGGDDEGDILLSATWDDPVGVANFYRIRTYVDAAFQPEQYTVLTDDFFGDGGQKNILIRERFATGTTVTVELLSTDEQYYDYFFQLSSVAGEGGNATTPYNPTGNFGPGVLGYFGIYYASTRSITL